MRRDFAGQSSAGVLLTARESGGGASNWVFSLDTRLRLSPNWVFSGQLLRSETREAGGARKSGPGYYARLEHTGRHFRSFSRYLDLSPDFRSELGFVRRVDIRQTEHWAEYRWRPEGKRVLSFGPSAAALVNWNREGRVADWIAGAGFDVELPGQTRFSIGRSDDFELYRGVGFRKNSTGASFSTECLRWLAVQASYTSGRSVNYSPATGLPPFSAHSWDAQAGLTLRPGAHVRLSQAYLYRRLAVPGGASLLNNRIWRSKVNWQITGPLSVRAIVDYDRLLPNAALVSTERTRRITGDVLLSWVLHPGTAVYVGYTDRERLGRQVFAKVSYLWRR